MNELFNKPLSLIVVVDENNGIGKDNKLLCHLPADLIRFKKITSGHKIIMGRNTYYSLPTRPLPNRENVILSDVFDEICEGCTVVHSIEQVLDICDSDKESFIIGGASIYKQFLGYCNKLYITKVHHSFEADTHFPEIDSKEWKLVEKENHKPDEKNKYSYSYLIYTKIL